MKDAQRYDIERRHSDKARALAPVSDEIISILDADVARICRSVMAAKNDDERRDIAADARATERLSNRIKQIITRGQEADRKLQQWSTEV